MLSDMRKAIVWSLLLVLFALGFVTSQSVQAVKLADEVPPGISLDSPSQEPDVASLGHKSFFPIINKPPVSLLGKVTYKGAPAAGQTIELGYFNGSTTSYFASILTDDNGYYQFDAKPVLSPGQYMFIRWINPGNDAWLTYWYSNTIIENPVSNLDFSFDIQDITLTASLANVTLPYTFNWTKRSTTSDSYSYVLFDPNNSSVGSESSPLGYVNAYRLTSLPGQFSTGTLYGWYPLVRSVNGLGAPYYYYEVKFTNRGTASVAQHPMGVLRSAQDWANRPIPFKAP